LPFKSFDLLTETAVAFVDTLALSEFFAFTVSSDLAGASALTAASADFIIVHLSLWGQTAAHDSFVEPTLAVFSVGVCFAVKDNFADLALVLRVPVSDVLILEELALDAFVFFTAQHALDFEMHLVSPADKHFLLHAADCFVLADESLASQA